ncbi:hypothetical protein JOF53_006347 [Crossiella equi]|uniref:PucR family transcriptional regulator n=2 Tax=Crossiella equi TaxID=130796 RepID=A0ABS5AP51_9PSEU|nr:helix-turn-helix domain-containing protein [Crossiella equi]MBP2477475.1 hypothetical protein [Crossiella equi]
MGTPAGSDRTLGQVLHTLGAPLLRVLAAPRGLGLPVTEPVLHDPVGPVAAEAGAILFAVGVAPEAARPLLRAAARCEVAAVVVRGTEEHVPVLTAAAEAEGVAVLLVHPQVPWRQLDSVLTAALTSRDDTLATLDLFTLANALAELLGGAVAIQDFTRGVLAHSTVPGQPIDELRQQRILGQPQGGGPESDDPRVTRRLMNAVSLCRFPGRPPTRLPRAAVAVRAGTEALGAIWVIEADGPLPPAAERTLLDAARTAALHLVRARGAADLERRIRGEQLWALLDGRGADGPGTDGFTTPAAVLAFEPADPDPPPATLTRLADLVTVFCAGVHPRAASVPVGRVVYTLLPLAGTGSGPVVALAEEIIRRTRDALGLRVRAAIGAPAPTPAGLARSRAEADRVLAALRGGPRQVGTIDDLRAETLLLALREEHVAGHPDLRVRALTAITEQDAQRGTQYVPTLRAYLESLGDIAVTAERLGVHQNTLRYRLRTLTDSFGLDLGDPDELLVLWLQLRLAD